MHRFLHHALCCALLGLAPAMPLRAATAADTAAPCCGSITPAAQALARVLDAADVEHHWLAHQHVNWETGEADRFTDTAGLGRATHCSAFAAAIGKRLGVYLLRPPAHSAKLLASAQTAWFASPAGQAQGWHALADAAEAQGRANAGELVVVSYANPDPARPGHIAIVRPSLKPRAELDAQGPQIIQAGASNSSSETARAGFAHHPGAWPAAVRYFGHAVPLPPD
jgi:hypothetical protein